MSKKTFHLVSLGCAKNTVDSDSMAQLLIGSGYQPVGEARKAGVLVVNTCGFIGPAKEESINVLKELAAKKKSGQVLIAAGCLTQRYGVEVARHKRMREIRVSRSSQVINLEICTRGFPFSAVCHL